LAFVTRRKVRLRAMKVRFIRIGYLSTPRREKKVLVRAGVEINGRQNYVEAYADDAVEAWEAMCSELGAREQGEPAARHKRRAS
jgi:hypothetical protein